MSAVVDVNMTRDFWDWFLVCVAAMSALGTMGAVIVALAWPGIQARRRKPRVALQTSGRMEWSCMLTYRTQNAHGDENVSPGIPRSMPVFWVTNERGRDPGRDVEVFVGVGVQAADGFYDEIAWRENLSFTEPNGGIGQAVTHVPPGFSRNVVFALLGYPERVFDEFASVVGETVGERRDNVVGALAVYPTKQDNVGWLREGDYAVSFYITGSNFDAVQYKATYKPWADERQHGIGAVERIVHFDWVEAPTLSRPRRKLLTRDPPG